MKIRTIVNAHLGRERLDALIAVLVPFVLMVESGYYYSGKCAKIGGKKEGEEEIP
jgi:hypothetical protein